MSELIQKNDSRATIRWKLLTSASALALTAYVSSGVVAKAEDSGQPQIWIELGGQLDRLEDGQEAFSPDFAHSPPRPSVFSPSQKFERPPLYGLDEFGEISFRPEDSDWALSASVRYGRSASSRNVHQQTNPAGAVKYIPSSYGGGGLRKITRQPTAARFAETKARTSEKHVVLDFQAGKDVGLGMFGVADGSSVVNLGVRFAQFRSKSNIALKSDPDWHFHYKYYPPLLSFGFTSSKIITNQPFHTNAASLSATRSFRGVGPSLSWSASAPFSGNEKNGELSLDWTANVALLFGRQKTRVHHQTTERYQPGGTIFHSVPYNRPGIVGTPVNTSHTRSRNITVPNVGGSIGLTYRLEDFKVSFGYKADFFFNAMDGGIDARKSENRAFYGPYASISIGLGD